MSMLKRFFWGDQIHSFLLSVLLLLGPSNTITFDLFWRFLCFSNLFVFSSSCYRCCCWFSFAFFFFHRWFFVCNGFFVFCHNHIIIIIRFCLIFALKNLINIFLLTLQQIGTCFFITLATFHFLIIQTDIVIVYLLFTRANYPIIYIVIFCWRYLRLTCHLLDEVQAFLVLSLPDLFEFLLFGIVLGSQLSWGHWGHSASLIRHVITRVGIEDQLADCRHLSHDQAVFHHQLISIGWFNRGGGQDLLSDLLHLTSVPIQEDWNSEPFEFFLWACCFFFSLIFFS